MLQSALMLNLVAFPHYTCGGLLCDILNQTWSPVGQGAAVQNLEHNIGKIGDSNTVLTDYSVDEVLSRIQEVEVPAGTWIGTHCHPTPELISHFDKVILITTATQRSQIYRWARAFYHFHQPRWQNIQEFELIDKIRETAKNYLVPFTPVIHDNVNNLEFADCVENNNELGYLLGNMDCAEHWQRWQSNNEFLYDKDFWNSVPVQGMYQAEFEIRHARHYRYQ